MQHSQIAKVGEFPFGAPAVLAEVLRFKVKKPGKLTIRVESPDGALTLSVKVSADNSSFSATTAAANTTAVTSVVVPQNTYKEYEVNMRAGTDLFVQVLASGSVRGIVQIRESENLDILKV